MCGQRKALRPIAVGLANHTLFLAKDDMERLIDDSGAPYSHSDGEIVDVVLVFHDVTERQRAEEIRTRFAALWSPRGRYHRPYFGRDHDELEPERRAAQVRDRRRAHSDPVLRRRGSASPSLEAPCGGLAAQAR